MRLGIVLVWLISGVAAATPLIGDGMEILEMKPQQLLLIKKGSFKRTQQFLFYIGETRMRGKQAENLKKSVPALKQADKVASFYSKLLDCRKKRKVLLRFGFYDYNQPVTTQKPIIDLIDQKVPRNRWQRMGPKERAFCLFPVKKTEIALEQRHDKTLNNVHLDFLGTVDLFQHGKPTPLYQYLQPLRRQELERYIMDWSL
jgi:hypothetical protein